jgi:hypothetical protein
MSRMGQVVDLKQVGARAAQGGPEATGVGQGDRAAPPGMGAEGAGEAAPGTGRLGGSKSHGR